MLLWIIILLGWVGVLALAISVFRLAGHVDRKVRGFSSRTRRRQDNAA